jgi:hypothetical protein
MSCTFRAAVDGRNGSPAWTNAGNKRYRQPTGRPFPMLDGLNCDRSVNDWVRSHTCILEHAEMVSNDSWGRRRFADARRQSLLSSGTSIEDYLGQSVARRRVGTGAPLRAGQLLLPPAVRMRRTSPNRDFSPAFLRMLPTWNSTFLTEHPSARAIS